MKPIIKDMRCVLSGKLLSKRCYSCNGFKPNCKDKIVCIETERDDLFGFKMR
jgi:hypothetical protein